MSKAGGEDPGFEALGEGGGMPAASSSAESTLPDTRLAPPPSWDTLSWSALLTSLVHSSRTVVLHVQARWV